MPPKHLYRVEFWQGLGFPKCDRRERARRTYDSSDDARKMVAEIERLPSHHRLERVWLGRVEWSDITSEFAA